MIDFINRRLLAEWNGITAFVKREHVMEHLKNRGYNGFLSLEPHLGSFEGLAELELDDEMEKLPKGGEGTFMVAYNALNAILDKILQEVDYE